MKCKFCEMYENGDFQIDTGCMFLNPNRHKPDEITWYFKIIFCPICGKQMADPDGYKKEIG